MERFWSKTKKADNGCIEWIAAVKSSKDPYGVFNRDGKNTILAHRMAWILAYGELPKGSVVRHLCDNPRCVNVDHLAVGSHADNVMDKVSKGRGNDGMKHGMHKLNDGQVREIRALEMNQYEIAKRYGVSQSVISEIRCRKSWDHI